MKKSLWLLMAFLAVVLIIPPWAMARVQGPCSDCHTMHNSQDGSPMTFDGSETPNRALTRGDCIGCHKGINTGSNNIPYVISDSAPTYGDFGIGDDSANTLAGGSFYWVQTDDAKGHNVVGIAGQDVIGYTPPGWNPAFDKNGEVAEGNSTWSSQLTCAGTYGCHGTHDVADDFAAIRGAHHADDSTIDGSTVGKSFRFLYGIKGVEDSDWEFQPTTGGSDHNLYYAVDRSDVTDPGSQDSATINYLCAECHGNFHSGSEVSSGTTGSPWLRHPSDFALNSASGSGYTNYPGPFGSAGTYWPGAPLGASDLSGGPQGTVSFDGTHDIVLCISCHRAHGSPYNDLLRWDYSKCEASEGAANATDCGCFACHTNKY